MSALLRSELFKARTTSTYLQLLAWMVGLTVLIVGLHDLSLQAHLLGARDNQLKILGWGTSIGALFAALLGAMSVTSEIRHGTIRPTFLAAPNRAQVIAAKTAAGALAGLTVGVLAEALAAGLGSAGLMARGIPIALSAGDYAQLLAGGAVAAALWAAIGVGVGALVRNQVGSVAGLCVWLLLIETTLIGNVPAAGKFAPGATAGALAGAIQTQTAANLLAPAVGLLLLIAYAAAASAAGSMLIARRDVS